MAFHLSKILGKKNFIIKIFLSVTRQVGNVTISGMVYTFAQTGEAICDSIPISKVFNSAGVELTCTNTSGKDTNESDGSSTLATSQENSNTSSHHHRTTVTKTSLIKVITAVFLETSDFLCFF